MSSLQHHSRWPTGVVMYRAVIGASEMAILCIIFVYYILYIWWESSHTGYVLDAVCVKHHPPRAIQFSSSEMAAVAPYFVLGPCFQQNKNKYVPSRNNLYLFVSKLFRLWHYHLGCHGEILLSGRYA